MFCIKVMHWIFSFIFPEMYSMVLGLLHKNCLVYLQVTTHGLLTMAEHQVPTTVAPALAWATVLAWMPAVQCMGRVQGNPVALWLRLEDQGMQPVAGLTPQAPAVWLRPLPTCLSRLAQGWAHLLSTSAANPMRVALHLPSRTQSPRARPGK